MRIHEEHRDGGDQERAHDESEPHRGAAAGLAAGACHDMRFFEFGRGFLQFPFHFEPDRAGERSSSERHWTITPAGPFDVISSARGPRRSASCRWRRSGHYPGLGHFSHCLDWRRQERFEREAAAYARPER